MYKMCDYQVMLGDVTEKGILNRNTNKLIVIKTWLLE